MTDNGEFHVVFGTGPNFYPAPPTYQRSNARRSRHSTPLRNMWSPPLIRVPRYP
jgi:hypothetical protein